MTIKSPRIPTSIMPRPIHLFARRIKPLERMRPEVVPQALDHVGRGTPGAAHVVVVQCRRKRRHGMTV